MKRIKERIEQLEVQQDKINTYFQPSFYRIGNTQDQKSFTSLLQTPALQLTNNILGQLKELMKIENPSLKLHDAEQEALALEHIGALSLEEYGVWVYYPWSNRLVHLLDEKEFIKVRTSRNQYKITPEEQEILSHKKIGVIGLSVGQSVSLTLAMERIGGELRLADFDRLELTNLNRIRTGVHNLGLPKVYAVAREIAEIDPFLTIQCFPEGLNESNMDRFFTDGGKLDLLIEESDGFDIKILSRYKAKSLQIPVIMEASDRCTVDVERFDLEPNRSILHGLVDHLDVSILKTLKTTEDKIPYLLDMVGLETSSLRLKASMLEIDQTINTWPQLASAVTMGGGIAADVSRRMLLNHFTESGRYHVDIEELIGNKGEPSLDTNPNLKLETSNNEKSLLDEEMNQIASFFKIEDIDHEIILDKNILETLIESAIKAPTGGNSQPWKWVYQQGVLLLFHDIEKSASLLDYDNLASYIGFGAATENLVLKAHEEGLEVSVQHFPLKEEKRLIAIYRFYNSNSLNKNFKLELHDTHQLIEGINKRTTNRNISERQIIDPIALKKLQLIAEEIEGAKMKVLDSPEQLAEMADIIGKVERLRLMEPRGHYDFINEVRWNPSEVLKTKNGVDLETVDINAAEKAGFIISKDWRVINTLKQWGKGEAFERLAKKTVAGASALGFIFMPQHSHENFIYGGRAVQKVWLAANNMNISFQPQSPLTFFFVRLLHGKGEGLEERTITELYELRKRFIKLIKTEDSAGEIFLFRLCIADEPRVKSLRKDVNEVFSFKK